MSIVFFVPSLNGKADGISTFVSSITSENKNYLVVETSDKNFFSLLEYVKNSHVCVFNGCYNIKYIFLCIAARLKGKKNIVINHGNISVNNLDFKKQFANFIYISCMRNFIDRFIVTSEAEFEASKKLNPIKLCLFPSESASISVGQKEKRFIYAGRVSKEKRVANFISAYNEVSKFHTCKLIIFGRLQDKSFPEEFREKYFCGELTHDDALSELARSYFSFNLSKSESFGYGIAESLASGTPVIVSSESEWPVEIGFGYRVDAMSMSSIINVLNKIQLLTHSEYVEMQRSGLDYIIKNLNKVDNIDLWREVFEIW